MFPEIVSNSFFEDKNRIKVERGKLIVSMNEIPRHGYLIVKGTARLYNTDSEGSEKTIAYMGQGDILSVEFLIGHAKSALYFCESVTEMELIRFSCSDFQKEIETNLELVQSMLKTISLGYFGSLAHIEALIQNKAQEKIVQLLRYLVLRFGKQVDDDWIAVNIRLTQSDLSEMLGITRETVAVELGKLKKAEIIDHGSFTYKVNLKALADLVDESLWSTFRSVSDAS